MNIPITRFDFANFLAKETGELLLKMFKTSGLEPSYKPDHSIVTKADKAADEFIQTTIQEHFPGETIISEELHPIHTTSALLPDDPVWVIDPLDGTTNFSLGLPFWGVSIACVKEGKPSVGAIYFPVIDELYSAQKTAGAYLNGKLLQQENAYINLSYFSCCSRTHKQYLVSVPYKTRILGSTCYTLCSIAKGISILGFEATPKIWDIAAGWLIIQEAGGVIEPLLDHSEPFPLQDGMDYSKSNFPILAGANQEVIAKARQQITRKAIYSD
jgi:myo-inositol-1(or 4)-monophosphatase